VIPLTDKGNAAEYLHKNVPLPNILLREKGTRPPKYFYYSGLKMEKPEDDPSNRHGNYEPYVLSRNEAMKNVQLGTGNNAAAAPAAPQQESKQSNRAAQGYF
jgi:hypothetical protein